jgi:thiol-disulfide isomerase/thioredoxin
MKSKRFWLGVVVGVMAVLLIETGSGTWFYYTQLKPMAEDEAAYITSKPLHPPPLSGKIAADYSLRLIDSRGTESDLSAFKGKVIVINFWASWCQSCVRELPSLLSLKRAVKDDPLIDVLCVNLENPHTAQRCLSKYHIALPVLCTVGKPSDPYNTRSIPATFIVSPAGQVVFSHFGAAKWDDPSVVDFLRKCKG